jgi:hypothetical protein
MSDRAGGCRKLIQIEGNLILMQHTVALDRHSKKDSDHSKDQFYRLYLIVNFENFDR